MIKEILLIGGDTDTNATIIGGIIGACVGVYGIRKDLIYQLIDFDSEKFKN